jgi:hypothetical protein
VIVGVRVSVLLRVLLTVVLITVTVLMATATDPFALVVSVVVVVVVGVLVVVIVVVTPPEVDDVVVTTDGPTVTTGGDTDDEVVRVATAGWLHFAQPGDARPARISAAAAARARYCACPLGMGAPKTASTGRPCFVSPEMGVPYGPRSWARWADAFF